jgi:HSP20 family protein
MPKEGSDMATSEKIRKGEKALKRRTTPSPVNPWDEMERWFGEFGKRGWLHPFAWEWPKEMEALAPFEGRMPRVDMVDRDEEVVIRAELPGVKKDDLEVTLSEHTVTIEAHTRAEEKEEKGEYYRREMSRGDFQRTLTVPAGVDETRARANFTDGVLELTLPKLEKTSRRKVKVE